MDWKYVLGITGAIILAAWSFLTRHPRVYFQYQGGPIWIVGLVMLAALSSYFAVDIALGMVPGALKSELPTVPLAAIDAAMRKVAVISDTLLKVAVSAGLLFIALGAFIVVSGLLEWDAVKKEIQDKKRQRPKGD